MKQFLICLAFLFASIQVIAQTDQAKPVQTMQVFGDYTVHFTVFNSTFITPDIARAYALTRGDNQVLINISVTKTSGGLTSLGLPAQITGTATNLIQQQQILDFKTISEGEATYYLASLRHTNEETINFSAEVQPEGVTAPFTVKFTRTLHVEN